MKLPSREVIAKQEVGHTDIPRWLSITTTLGFLALILIAPVIQTANELSADQRPQALEVFDLPGLAQSNDDLLVLINQYEDRLEDESLLRGKLLGPAQNFLTTGSRKREGLHRERGLAVLSEGRRLPDKLRLP